MTLRRIGGTTLLTIVLGAVLAPAASAQYPPTAGGGQVNRARVEPGQCVTFSGGGFLPTSSVSITDNGAAVKTVNAGATGSFSTQVCPTVLGVHTIRGTGTAATGGSRTVSAQVTVVRDLATTGASGIGPAVGAGLGFIFVGAGFVYLARRRRVVRFS